MHDFWPSCNYRLLRVDAGGRLVASDEFLKSYLLRPELAPIPDSCAAELELLARHAELALATDVFLRLRFQVERLEAELRAFTQDDRAA